MDDLRSRAEEALYKSATRLEDGRWVWEGGNPHTEAQALAIAEACLLLDVPVTDCLTSRAWLRLVERLVELEERVALVEAEPRISWNDSRFGHAVLEVIRHAKRERWS